MTNAEAKAKAVSKDIEQAESIRKGKDRSSKERETAYTEGRE